MFYGQNGLKKPLNFQKNDTILNSRKIGHFAKAVVRQNPQKWRTLGENHTKDERQHTQEIFYGKNGQKKIKYSRGDTILKIGKISHYSKPKWLKMVYFEFQL